MLKNGLNRRQYPIKLYILGLIVLAISLLSQLVNPLLANAASCTPPATTYGTDTMVVGVTSSTTYSIWVRMQAPAASSNSILLKINGSNCYQVGGSASMPLNSWQWINYQNGSASQTMQASLNAGNNSFVLIGTSPGVMVDEILALGDNSCVPTGTGSNCTTLSTPSPPPTTRPTGTTTGASNNNQSINPSQVIKAPTLVKTAAGVVLSLNNGTVSISDPVLVSPTYVKGQTIDRVYYYLNGKLVYTANKPPYTYHLNTNKLSDGKYLLTSKTVYISGLSKTASETINVKHSLIKNTGIVLVNHLLILLLLMAVVIVFMAVLLSPKPLTEHILERLHLHKAPNVASVPDFDSTSVISQSDYPTSVENIVTPTANIPNAPVEPVEPNVYKPPGQQQDQ